MGASGDSWVEKYVASDFLWSFISPTSHVKKLAVTWSQAEVVDSKLITVNPVILPMFLIC